MTKTKSRAIWLSVLAALIIVTVIGAVAAGLGSSHPSEVERQCRAFYTRTANLHLNPDPQSPSELERQIAACVAGVNNIQQNGSK